MPTRILPTDKELMALPKDGHKRELLNGEIVMSSAGFEHGRRIVRFSSTLAAYVYAHDLGEVSDGQTGFRMKSGDVLSPDVSFIVSERVERLGDKTEGFFEGAPDLAVEFLSPGESLKRLSEKVTQYLANGSRLVWIIDSRRRNVTEHDSAGTERVLGEKDDLAGGGVVPGFQMSVAALFADSRPRA